MSEYSWAYASIRKTPEYSTFGILHRLNVWLCNGECTISLSKYIWGVQAIGKQILTAAEFENNQSLDTFIPFRSNRKILLKGLLESQSFLNYLLFFESAEAP